MTDMTNGLEVLHSGHKGTSKFGASPADVRVVAWLRIECPTRSAFLLRSAFQNADILAHVHVHSEVLSSQKPNTSMKIFVRDAYKAHLDGRIRSPFPEFYDFEKSDADLHTCRN